MCNACGFRCCASDQFSRCGCDDCSDRRCWPVDDDDAKELDDFFNDDEPQPLSPGAEPQ